MQSSQPRPSAVRIPIRLGSTKTRLKDTLKIQKNESIGLVNASSLRICGVCHENESKYTCPRCNMVYCGVGCYKTHGTTCTEQFYKSHVESEMLLNKSSDTVQEVKEMLQRVHDEFPETSPLDERIDDLVEMMESNALTLDDLTETERSNFLREVADGRLGKFIELWEPWWNQPISSYEKATHVVRNQLIQALDDDVIDLTNENDTMDEVLLHPVGMYTSVIARDLPQLETLHSSPNHQSLGCNLVEILFAYTYVMRVYNGDWRTDVLEAGSLCLAYSSVLQGSQNYTAIPQVIQSCQSCNRIADQNDPARQAALCDVVSLVSASLYVLDALSDLMQLIQAMKVEEPSRNGRKQLTRVLKKIHFYLVWVHDQSTKPRLAILYQTLVDYIKET